MKKYLGVLSIIIMLLGCGNPQKLKKKIMKAKNVSLYSIASTPVMPKLQIPDKLYLLDYQVQENIKLTAEQKTMLKKALSNQSNYSKDDIKKCPFMPSYALQFDSSLVAIIGLKPCARIQLKINKSNEKVMDLVKDNEIEKTLYEIVK